MVVEIQHNDTTWYECESCGLMLNHLDEAQQHEQSCNGEEPNYLQ
jgi:hypothetical protein